MSVFYRMHLIQSLTCISLGVTSKVIEKSLSCRFLSGFCLLFRRLLGQPWAAKDDQWQCSTVEEILDSTCLHAFEEMPVKTIWICLENWLVNWNALSTTLKILEAETEMQSQYILANVGDLQSPMQDPSLIPPPCGYKMDVHMVVFYRMHLIQSLTCISFGCHLQSNRKEPQLQVSCCLLRAPLRSLQCPGQKSVWIYLGGYGGFWCLSSRFSFVRFRNLHKNQHKHL